MGNLLWWAVTVPLLPLLLPQAWYTRRVALRLPPARGEPCGLVGAHLSGQPLRVTLIGESTVVGVGVATLEDSLAAQLAHALSGCLGRPVLWRVCGENGIDVRTAAERLLPQALAEPMDLALLVFGVNDTTGLSSRRRWQLGLEQLITGLQAGGARVALSDVPPLQHFAALPWLLRTQLGWRTSLLNGWSSRLARRLAVRQSPLMKGFSGEFLAEDGYHPSALGYRAWAETLAAQLITECHCPPPG